MKKEAVEKIISRIIEEIIKDNHLERDVGIGGITGNDKIGWQVNLIGSDAIKKEEGLCIIRGTLATKYKQYKIRLWSGPSH